MPPGQPGHFDTFQDNFPVLEKSWTNNTATTSWTKILGKDFWMHILWIQVLRDGDREALEVRRFFNGRISWRKQSSPGDHTPLPPSSLWGFTVSQLSQLCALRGAPGVSLQLQPLYHSVLQLSDASHCCCRKSSNYNLLLSNQLTHTLDSFHRVYTEIHQTRKCDPQPSPPPPPPLPTLHPGPDKLCTEGKQQLNTSQRTDDQPELIKHNLNNPVCSLTLRKNELFGPKHFKLPPVLILWPSLHFLQLIFSIKADWL